MNQKTKNNLVAFTIGLLLVDRLIMTAAGLRVKKENEILRSNNKTLAKQNRFLVRFGLSLVNRVPPEQLSDVKTDLEFFDMTNQ